MKNPIFNLLVVAIFAISLVSCGNKERKVNSDGVDSDKIKVESAILDEYGKLMPGCKNLISVSVEGIDIDEALVYIDEEAGDAFIEESGVLLAPYEAGKKINMIVSFEEKGGKKEFEVADKLPEPQIRFFNAETNEIMDYEIENVASVIIELVGDDKFTELFPEDSEYRILAFEAAVKRNDEIVKSFEIEKDYEKHQIDISTLQDVAVAGDTIVIKVKAAQRKDYDGNWHDVEIPEKVKEVSLKIK